MLTNLQEQQNQLTKAAKEYEMYLKLISADLEEMIQNSVDVSIQDPYGKNV